VRISDDRYSRDRLRFDIALQFIQHEARTNTIRAWTGLSDDRIRKLYRSYLCDCQGTPLTRHRGKSPQLVAFFMRSARVRQEAALLASLCRLLGALPQAATPELARSLPGLARGELLCQAYEAYRGLVPDALISFEHAVFLLTTLVRGDELVLGGCRDCGAALLVDRWSLRAPRCPLCATDHAQGAQHALDGAAPPMAAAGASLTELEPLRLGSHRG
jgi:Flagellar transcriptional activator (FlhC)